MEPIKHVPIGTQFTGTTHTNRVIPLGKVVAFDQYFDLAHKVCWYDENGKHYEWFNLHNPGEEFATFEIIHKEGE
jgi:hypothetical protein